MRQARSLSYSVANNHCLIVVYHDYIGVDPIQKVRNGGQTLTTAIQVHRN